MGFNMDRDSKKLMIGNFSHLQRWEWVLTLFDCSLREIVSISLACEGGNGF